SRRPEDGLTAEIQLANGPERWPVAGRVTVAPSHHGQPPLATLVRVSEHVIYLLRHGETEWSANGRHTGNTDIPLTEQGERAARRAGRGLRALRGEQPALVRVSPRERATRTAQLANLGTLGEVHTEPLLAEWDYGAYEGRTTAHIQQDVPGWTL